MATEEKVALFLFAHQDDEFGVYQKISDELKNNYRVCCAYLTDGCFNVASPQRRNLESLNVLRKLGVQETNVFFPGQALVIPDLKLHEHLHAAAHWINQWFLGFSQVISIYVPAWEGGHPDHDALHAITASIAENRGMLPLLRQFPLYNGYRCPGPLYRIFSPLLMNGAVEEVEITWKDRLIFLRYCLCYPSQAVTWLGIFPFVVFYYLFVGKQILQPVSLDRTHHRPHGGALYYEKRGFYTWEQMAARLADFQQA